MFSAMFSIVFAMGLVSVESSTVQSAFEVAMRCTKKDGKRTWMLWHQALSPRKRSLKMLAFT